MDGREPGLGEHVGDPRRYVTEPGTTEDTDLLKGIFQDKRKASPSRTPRLDPIEDIREYGMPTYRTIPVGARLVQISPQTIGITSLRIDRGLEFRKDILIVNMSANVVWVNTIGASVNNGFPLGPISAAGKYDGGSLSVDATSDVEWYAVASAVGSLIIVVETAR